MLIIGKLYGCCVLLPHPMYRGCVRVGLKKYGGKKSFSGIVVKKEEFRFSFCYKLWLNEVKVMWWIRSNKVMQLDCRREEEAS